VSFVNCDSVLVWRLQCRAWSSPPAEPTGVVRLLPGFLPVLRRRLCAQRVVSRSASSPTDCVPARSFA
jgi:hypothetical protein